MGAQALRRAFRMTKGSFVKLVSGVRYFRGGNRVVER